MTDESLGRTPRDDELEELLRRTPDTDRETASSALDPWTTDQEFWGFADTFKRIPLLSRVEEVTPSPPLKLIETHVVETNARPPTPPRIPIPRALSPVSSPELTPLPRVWNAGDLLMVLLIALTMTAIAISLLVQ